MRLLGNILLRILRGDGIELCQQIVSQVLDDNNSCDIAELPYYDRFLPKADIYLSTLTDKFALTSLPIFSEFTFTVLCSFHAFKILIATYRIIASEHLHCYFIRFSCSISHI